jgi:Ca-activated chloride channel family protein
MFRFESPEYLYLLLFIPALIVLYFYATYKKSRRLREYGDVNIMSQLMPNVSKHRPITKFIIMLIVIGLLSVLIARPQFGTKAENVKRNGIEIMIAMDISNSMYARDVQPSRLERAKMLVSQLVDKLENDKIGFIVFAGDAFTQLPITSDYISAKMFLDNISPALIQQQGTAIGSAVSLATRSFTPQKGIGKMIILITDGENHEPGAEDAVTEAQKKGIEVCVLGIGMPNGAPIPIPGRSDYLRDSQGNAVVTKLDETMCRTLAKLGKGIFARVDNSDSAQKAIEGEIDKSAKADINSKIYSEYNEQFQAIAWLILLLLIADILVIDYKNPRFKNIHLFSNKLIKK